MAYRNPLKVIGVQREDGVKGKIASTIKEIELHRRELESMRNRLAQRRKLLYDTTVRALTAKDKSKANVYANEWAELRKVAKVVYASELALTQVILRLESINDVGDVISHMSTAFKVLRKVSKTVQGLVPALDQASEEINTTLTETMADLYLRQGHEEDAGEKVRGGAGGRDAAEPHSYPGGDQATDREFPQGTRPRDGGG